MSNEFTYDRINDYAAVKISLAKPNDIRSWSYGEVKKPETINYRTYRPERDGLFCEKIFGPEKDWECACGKYRGMKYKGMTCDRCGVKITHSRVRRKRMGHIDLAAPVVHIWFFKAASSRLATLLSMKATNLEKVIYFQDYVVIDAGDTPLEVGKLLTEEEYRNKREEYPAGSFVADMGAEAIRKLLQNLDLVELSKSLRVKLTETKSKQTKKDLINRLKLVESLRDSNNKPEWMVLDAIPVIPPDLRPLVLLESGTFATSDLNDLYRRIINRNNRLKKLVDLNAPEVIIRNEKRMLQQSVDALFDNGRCKRPVLGSSNRPLKSLTDMIKGKQGRFRENLLGKRVDYSARSVIVVGPNLRLHQCGLPKKIALELFQPFIIRRLKELGHADTIKSAKKMLERKDEEVWDILEEVIQNHPVLLNRAPTLHRMGIQAFEPILVEGNAIKLHPLVCRGFNADFDGDQMAVHLPLSLESQVEAHTLMLSTNNIFSPANGAPIISPSQDVVMGCYYLTMSQPGMKGEGMVFASREEVLLAHFMDKIDLHAKIWVRMPRGRWLTTSDINRLDETYPESGSFTSLASGRKKFTPSPSELDYLKKVEVQKKWEGWGIQAKEIGLKDSEEKSDEVNKLILRLEEKEKRSLTRQEKDRLIEVKEYWEKMQKVLSETKINEEIDKCKMELGRLYRKIYYLEYSKDPVWEEMLFVTTPGRIIFNDILPSGMPYYNQTLKSGGLQTVISDCHEYVDRQATIDLLDRLMSLGFEESTHSGLSFATDDLITPASKEKIIELAEKKVAQKQDQYMGGIITEVERYNQVLDAWTHAREEITKQMMLELENDTRESWYVNPIFLMANSGARGGVEQIRQLAGMRGLMAKPSGKIIETPIKANFREGLSVLEYFSSTHGARKGLADTALKTADSGYLTRKLADVAQNVVVTTVDCGTTQGITKGVIYRGEKVEVGLVDSIRGRVSRANIVNPITDEVIVRENELITVDIAQKIEALGLEKIQIRSPMTCEAELGVCRKCYGMDLSTSREVEEGLAVGIIAAQSIGEPGTQLTMRTFHIGGVAARDVEESEIKSKYAGTVRFVRLEVIESKITKERISLARNGAVAIFDHKNREREKFDIPIGSMLLVADGDQVYPDFVLSVDMAPMMKSVNDINWSPPIASLIKEKSIKTLAELAAMKKEELGKLQSDKIAELEEKLKEAGYVFGVGLPLDIRAAGAGKQTLFSITNFTVSPQRKFFINGSEAKTIRSARVTIIDDKGKREVRPEGIKLTNSSLTFDGKTDEKLKTGKIEIAVESAICTWDPHSVPIYAKVAGTVNFVNVDDETVRSEKDMHGNMRLIVSELKGDRQPQIDLKSEDGTTTLDYYYLPDKAIIEVKNGAKVERGVLLAKTPRDAGGTQDITGGLPRVTEIFEARKPKDPAVIAEIDGSVELGEKRHGKRTIVIKNEETGAERIHEISHGKHMKVQAGDFVKAGQSITDGPLVPHDILRISGEEAVQEYLVREIQNVYRSQRVKINDKHIEIIVSQMLRKVKIESAGDTKLLEGVQVDKFQFKKANEEIKACVKITDPGDTKSKVDDIVQRDVFERWNAEAEAAGHKQATAKKTDLAHASTQLLGITKAAVQSSSFISAASFQETTKVLTEAALASKTDNLIGLKENVILGHLVPAGTGFRSYQNAQWRFRHEAVEELAKQVTTAAATKFTLLEDIPETVLGAKKGLTLDLSSPFYNEADAEFDNDITDDDYVGGDD